MVLNHPRPFPSPRPWIRVQDRPARPQKARPCRRRRVGRARIDLFLIIHALAVPFASFALAASLKPDPGGDILDGAGFLDVKLDQVGPRWRRPRPQTSPLYFQLGGFQIFDPGHYKNMPEESAYYS